MSTFMTLTALFSVNELKAQDPEFSQFYATPLYTNPAFAGSAWCPSGAAGRASIAYRNQWPSLPGTYRTFAASWDQHVPTMGGGLGLMATVDRAGEGLLTSTVMSGIYSYLLPINRDVFFRFGLQASFHMKSLDFSKLRFADQIDATRGFVYNTQEKLENKTRNFPNFAAGMLMYSKKVYGGLAIHNVIEPNQSFYKNPDGNLPRRYTAHFGAMVPLDKTKYKQEAYFSPNMLFMLQQNFTQLNFGFYVGKGPLVTGLWFRQTFGQYKNSDALMALIGFRKDRLKVAYSYDITVSSGRSAIPASHELTATIDWCLPPTRTPFRPVPCPGF